MNVFKFAYAIELFVSNWNKSWLKSNFTYATTLKDLNIVIYQNKADTKSSVMTLKLVNEFRRGIELLENLDDEIYTKTSYGVGSIGSHFRHNLDFANNLLAGIESNKIDYNERERDLRVETDRQYAKERFLFLIQTLKNISTEDFGQEILVRSEIDEDEWHASSIARELEFLHSHTVHHFALIAEKLHSFGIKVSRDFGVAPSTLKFWAEQKSKTKVA